MISKEQKTEWLRRLRSGEYKQGKHMLGEKQGEYTAYCCLGVLGEQIGACEWSNAYNPKLQSSLPSWSNELQEHGQVSTSYLGTGELSEEQQRALSEMNDQGASFVEIAHWIEEYIDAVD